MNKLNVKEINYSYNTYKISQLGSDNMELPEYGVVFADGRCVSCNFGSHFVAYGIGALLLIAENFLEKHFYRKWVVEMNVRQENCLI